MYLNRNGSSIEYMTAIFGFIWSAKYPQPGSASSWGFYHSYSWLFVQKPSKQIPNATYPRDGTLYMYNIIFAYTYIDMFPHHGNLL